MDSFPDSFTRENIEKKIQEKERQKELEYQRNQEILKSQLLKEFRKSIYDTFQSGERVYYYKWDLNPKDSKYVGKRYDDLKDRIHYSGVGKRHDLIYEVFQELEGELNSRGLFARFKVFNEHYRWGKMFCGVTINTEVPEKD